MINKNLISVIIPLYNGEKFLNKCINSVIKQSYQNWELIIVNDCSTDNSEMIINHFIRNDNRIKIINKIVNEKTFKARITGLKNINGKYFTFLDQDDWMHPNALEKLHENALNTNADVVVGSWRRVFDNYGFIKSKSYNLYYSDKIDSTFESNEINEKFKFSFYGHHGLPVLVWSKLYKSELKTPLISNTLPNIHIVEDLYFNLIIFNNVNKISFIKDLIINWRYGGISQKHKPDYLLNYNELYLLRLKLIENYEDKMEYFKPIYNELSNVFYYYLLDSIYIGKFSKNDIINEYEKFKNYESYITLIKFIKVNKNHHLQFYENLESENFDYIYNTLLSDIKKIRFKRGIKRFIGNLLLKF